MSNALQALKFARAEDNPHLHGDAQKKIFALLQQVHEVYNDFIRQPSGKVCDICGKGDSGVYHKAGRILPGYEHRQDVMPTLCWPHASGWSRTYRAMESKRRADLFEVDDKSQVDFITYTRTPVISDEEANLHFAHYLATQLLKAKHETHPN